MLVWFILFRFFRLTARVFRFAHLRGSLCKRGSSTFPKKWRRPTTAQCPDQSTQRGLHAAAHRGDAATVMNLIVATPNLVHAKEPINGWTPLSAHLRARLSLSLARTGRAANKCSRSAPTPRRATAPSARRCIWPHAPTRLYSLHGFSLVSDTPEPRGGGVI